MSLTNQIRDMWCRFQGELFPGIQAEVGPPLKGLIGSFVRRFTLSKNI